MCLNHLCWKPDYYEEEKDRLSYEKDGRATATKKNKNWSIAVFMKVLFEQEKKLICS